MTINYSRWLVLLFSFLCLILYCSEEAPCDKGQPEPMFSEDIIQVKRHNFVRKGQNSEEEADLDNGIKVVLLQSGCEDIKQEFRFTLPGNYGGRNKAFFFRQAMNQFNYISTFTNELGRLGLWASVIQNKKEEILLGDYVQLEPGAFVKVDHILGAEEVILIMILSSKGA